MNFLFRYANPHEFMRLSGVVLPVFAIATALCFAIGLYLGFSVPPDYQQGTTVILMFIHVPADVVAELAYGAIVWTVTAWRRAKAKLAALEKTPRGTAAPNT